MMDNSLYIFGISGHKHAYTLFVSGYIYVCATYNLMLYQNIIVRKLNKETA